MSNPTPAGRVLTSSLPVPHCVTRPYCSA